MSQDLTYAKDAAFCKVVPLVLKVEAGYVDNPVDPGGPTMYGIAWNYNSAELGRLGITRYTMHTLTLDQAKQLYFTKYWLLSGASGISDEGLAYMHLDCAVNCGPVTAAQILGSLRVDPKKFDGSGDHNSALFLRLVMEYEMKRLDFYTHTKASLKKEYLEGWVDRMIFVGQQAEKLV